MRKKKFTRGNPILSVSYAVELIVSGNYVFFREKPMHPGWMAGMPLRTIMNLVQRGLIYQALRNE